MTRFTQTIASICLFAATTVASAATVTVRFDDQIFGTTGYGALSASYGSTLNQSEVNGRLRGSVTAMSGIASSDFSGGISSLYMYCYDILQPVSAGWTVNYTVAAGGVTARTLDFLGAVNSVLGQGGSTIAPDAWLNPANADQSAAIGIGIWETQWDASGWLSDGEFRATNYSTGVGTWLETFRLAMDSTASLGSDYVMLLTSSTQQDMLTGRSLAPPTTEVPEPATLALVGLGLVGIVSARRRRAT